MKRFRLIATDFDVRPALDEIMATPASHWEIARIENVLPDGYRTIDETLLGPAISALGMAALKRAAGGYQAKAINPRILACPPRSRVRPHKDYAATGARATALESNQGKAWKRQYRHQLALQCDRGAYFRISQERARFRPGELWLCDIGDATHEMNNDSDLGRIVLRFDVVYETDAMLVNDRLAMLAHARSAA